VTAMVPREHGTYVQLFVPLGCAWMHVTEWGAGAWLSCAALFFFLAGAPLRELRRRPRAARRTLLAYLVVALTALGVGVSSARPGVAALMLLPSALLCAAAALVLSGRTRSLAGEVVVALALSSWSLPVAACGPLSLADSLWVWVPFATYFGVSTVAVRHLMPRSRRRDGLSSAVVLGLCAVLLGVSVGAVALGELSVSRAVALGPSWATPALLVWVQPAPTRIRSVGKLLLIGSVVTCVLVSAQHCVAHERATALGRLARPVDTSFAAVPVGSLGPCHGVMLPAYGTRPAGGATSVRSPLRSPRSLPALSWVAEVS
jgi:hypothetical protein